MTCVLGYTEHLSPLLYLLMDECSSLHCTLLTLLPPQSPCDFTSHRVHWTWLGLMPRPLLLSTSICLMDRGGLHVEYAYYELFIHTVIFIQCILTLNLSFWSHDIYCSVHPGEGSSSVLS